MKTTKMRYDIVLIEKCVKELKEHFKTIHDYDSNYKHTSILSKQQHKEEYEKINEMIKKFDKEIGNSQFYMSHYVLEDYQKEIDFNSNKNKLDNCLWHVFNETMGTLKDLYIYEVTEEWKQ